MSAKDIVDGAEPSFTVQMIIEGRQRGQSFAEIGERWGMKPEEAYRYYTEYMESSKALSEQEYRMLQLSRLEKLIDVLWDATMDGMSLDHVDSMLKVLQEISKLLGLHKAKNETIVTVIDQRQTQLVVAYVDAVAETLVRRVMDIVGSKKAREQIESNWPEWVAQASAEPLRVIEADKVKV